MKDLTKGKPSRLILAFAIPIFMANILQLTYSIVDTRIVGSYLGENSLAAVGATTTLSNLMIGFLMGMAVSYIFIIIAGLATFLYDACAAALRALGDTVTSLVSSSLEMVGKIVIAFTLVPLLGYTGVIVAEPIVWFIMVIPLLVKIYNMPVLRKQPVSVSLKN
jgi:Na+-driven multidrug efflux pump